MNIIDSFQCITYNIISSFYIFLNLLCPYYGEDILKMQYKSIECINENIIFESNARKRRRFNIFVENLIVKNNELIEKMKQQEEEDNNIDNYERIQDDNDETDVIQDDETESGTDTEQDQNDMDDPKDNDAKKTD